MFPVLSERNAQSESGNQQFQTILSRVMTNSHLRWDYYPMREVEPETSLFIPPEKCAGFRPEITGKYSL